MTLSVLCMLTPTRQEAPPALVVEGASFHVVICRYKRINQLATCRSSEEAFELQLNPVTRYLKPGAAAAPAERIRNKTSTDFPVLRITGN